jgi:hypothetical protein
VRFFRLIERGHPAARSACMASCPECEYYEEGDTLSCPECGKSLVLLGADELEVADEDEDDLEDDDDDDEVEEDEDDDDLDDDDDDEVDEEEDFDE